MTHTRRIAFFVVHSIFLTVLLGASFAFLTHTANAQQVIQGGQPIPAGPAETPAQKQAELQAELTEVEAEQAAAQKTLTDAQAQSSSLKKDIAVLTAQINVDQLNIKAKNLLLQTLGKDITDKQSTINTLQGQIDEGHETLAQILRKTNELDEVTLPEVILSEQNVTDIFSDLDTFQSVQEALATTFTQIRSTEAQTQAAKDALNTQKDNETDALQAIQTDQANIKSAQSQKNTLLTVSKGNEQTYTQVVAQKAAQAAQIRAALFALAGGGQAIPFGTALTYANAAKQATGIDPAFLLAILTQESDLGSNVGRCYLTDEGTGAGVNSSTGKTYPNVMKPTRDVPPFVQITTALGLDPLKTVVSCPIAGAGGWGGAMGPAQFIASTWELLVPRLITALGVPTPNPWNPKDAFTASAMFLSDLGATGTSYSSELKAACKYYGTGGSTCAYGRSVMSYANQIQTTEIDPLQGV